MCMCYLLCLGNSDIFKGVIDSLVMEEYISKAALVAEIERMKDEYLKHCKNKVHAEWSCGTLDSALSFIDTLEVKEVDDELQGIEKEVAEGFVERINKKRIPISLKGEKKAKFKNEFNTLWQTIDNIQFANVAKYIIERLCLHFAAWGSYNLKEIGQIDKDDKKEMDIEVKEVDLEKEINKYIDDEWCDEYSGDVGNWIRYRRGTRPMTVEDVIDIAKHFFELGMSVSNKAQEGE